MNDLGNLLQMIYDLLSGWFTSFTSHATAVMEKLNLIEDDTDTIVSNTSDIADDTNDIKDNTGAIITPVQSIKTNTDSIKTDTTTIKNNVSTMTNQLGTISTNVGTASAFTEDVANNTLDIKDKVVTIASDTTQIRSNTNTVVTDMSKVYEALKWALVDKVITETEEGDNSVSFDTDLTNDLVSLEVSIEPTQTGSGTPSPSNPRAISGFDSGVVTRCGVNLWDEEWEVGGLNTSTGGNWNTSDRIRSKNYISIKPSTSIYIKYPTSGVSVNCCFYDANKTFISAEATVNSAITIPSNAFFMRFATYAQYGTTYNNDISINYPATDTDYHAYNGNTYTFAFGQTVYGGHFDNKGNLVVTHGLLEFDGSSDENWATAGDGFYLGNAFPADFSNSTSKTTPICLCNEYKEETAITSSVEIQYRENYSYFNQYGTFIRRLWIKNADITSVENFKTWLSNNPLQIVYPLATPTTIQLTPTQIATIKGINTIITDGNISVTYEESVKHYLDKQDN